MADPIPALHILAFGAPEVRLGKNLVTFSTETCQVDLSGELGVEPEPDTAELAERIRTQAPLVRSHIPRAAAQPCQPDTSVAFLGNLFAGRISEFQTLVNS